MLWWVSRTPQRGERTPKRANLGCYAARFCASLRLFSAPFGRIPLYFSHKRRPRPPKAELGRMESKSASPEILCKNSILKQKTLFLSVNSS